MIAKEKDGRHSDTYRDFSANRRTQQAGFFFYLDGSFYGIGLYKVLLFSIICIIEMQTTPDTMIALKS